MTRAGAIAWATLMLGASALLLIGVLAGCPKPTPPVVAPQPDGYKVCPGSSLPVAEDVCERRFTSDGFACAKCPPTASGCFVQAYSVYCVMGGNCADARCHVDPGPGP